MSQLILLIEIHTLMLNIFSLTDVTSVVIDYFFLIKKGSSGYNVTINKWVRINEIFKHVLVIIKGWKLIEI